MLTTWDKFYPDILMDAPTCANPVMDRALIRAAQEFFDTTSLWRVVLDPIAVVADVIQYDMMLEPGSELVRIERAVLDQRPIDITSTMNLPSDWKTSNDMRNCIHTIDRKSVYVLPKPKASGSLSIEVVLKPTNSANGIDSIYFDHYAEVIAKGAKARLLSHPSELYTNPNQALVFGQEFKEAMNSLCIRAQRGFSSTRSRLAGRFF